MAIFIFFEEVCLILPVDHLVSSCNFLKMSVVMLWRVEEEDASNFRGGDTI